MHHRVRFVGVPDKLIGDTEIQPFRVGKQMLDAHDWQWTFLSSHVVRQVYSEP